MPETVMIVAGETSGELYGALLASSLRRKRPDLTITGIGGQRMKEAGVNLIAGISSAFGFSEVLSSVSELKKTFNKAVEALVRDRPTVLVLIDYPDFNLRLAEKAKKMGIKILYYVSPQVWVWRRKRIYKIARLVDKMAVILPFEEKIYTDIGVDCEFVGHPVMDELRSLKADKKGIRESLGLNPESPLLALLPGSRPDEINRLLPVMTEVISVFKKEFPDFQFCIPFAPNTDLDTYRSQVRDLRKEGVLINQGKSVEVLAASDCAVIASGTASLQAVLQDVPIVVIYKVTGLTYLIGRLVLKGEHISLANIISGREVVQEFIQDRASAKNVMDELRKILTDSGYRDGMLSSFAMIRDMFSGRRASERVSDMVLAMAGTRE
ncbi:MAG: lipid-A-disaccharide synthase [Nitrospirae bacterium]|nr:lipid-A-disaccharide synthase [Nitrospirota bacterium]